MITPDQKYLPRLPNRAWIVAIYINQGRLNLCPTSLPIPTDSETLGTNNKMTIPQTFQQAVFKSAGAPLVIEEAPLTSPGPNEILVKVEACGVCFSDVFAQNNIMGGGLYVSLLPPHWILLMTDLLTVPSSLVMRLSAV
jgi:hypothetical protein